MSLSQYIYLDIFEGLWLRSYQTGFMFQIKNKILQHFRGQVLCGKLDNWSHFRPRKVNRNSYSPAVVINVIIIISVVIRRTNETLQPNTIQYVGSLVPSLQENRNG